MRIVGLRGGEEVGIGIGGLWPVCPIYSLWSGCWFCGGGNGGCFGMLLGSVSGGGGKDG